MHLPQHIGRKRIADGDILDTQIAAVLEIT